MDYLSFKCSARDGLRLAGRKYGWDNRDAHPIVCLAGITRNASDFHDLAMFLAGKGGGMRRVMALDFRGRGESEYDSDPNNYSLSTEASDVLDVLTALDLGKVNIIGSSRGGMIAMLLAAMRPGALKSVILNDIGPVIDPTGLVRIWRTYDTRNAPSTYKEAAELRKRMGTASSPAFDDDEWMKEAKRLYREEDGKLALRFDKNLLKSLRSINLDERLPDMWPEFAALTKIPTLAIRAENSDLLSEETFGEMKILYPDLQTCVAEGQSHAPILSVGKVMFEVSTFLEMHR